MEITVKDYMLMQPHYPKVADADKFYLHTALKLSEAWNQSALSATIPDDLARNVVLAVVGYFQDVVADSGIWRSFVTIHNSYYGKPLPFYPVDDEYCISELNEADIRFLIWYILECHSADYGKLSPFDSEIANLAHVFFSILDEEYLDAPTSTEYMLAMDVELDNVGQVDQIFKLSSWLFYNNYLMRHAARGAMQDAMHEAQQIIAKHQDKDKAAPHLQDLNDRTMLANPTGPLALTIGEWLKMVVENEIPQKDESTSAAVEHKFYKQLINATGGKNIAFFDSYDALETFLSDGMGWGQTQKGHLPHLRQFNNFVVFGTPASGILVAHDVTQFINHPDNPCFDKAAAATDGYRIITSRGACPADLLKYALSNGLLQDIRMPYDPDGSLLNDNWDFLARLYQQRYYRPD